MMIRSGFLAFLILPAPLWAAGPVTVWPREDGPSAFFGLNRLWDLHLDVSAEEWKALQPRGGGFGPPPRLAPPEEGKVRSQFGYEFTYVKADLTIAGQTFKDIGLRYKGNSTYATTSRVLKRPFKVELDRNVEGQAFLGVRKLSLNVHVMDPTLCREALAYAVYREAGVPAPRTAFGFLTLSVPGKYDREVVGLYTLIENIDKAFLKDRFGSSKGILLKPERVGPLDHLGNDWKKYEDRYRPRGKPSEAHQKRFIELTRLVQTTDVARFRRELPSYVDIDCFLRYVAATVMLASLDSFIGLPHNYYVYLDPLKDRFVILPWDLDHSFGGLMMFSSSSQMWDLSIRKPWLGRNPLVEKVLANPVWFAQYKKHLESLMSCGFVPERIKSDAEAVTKLVATAREKEKAAASKRGDGWALMPLNMLMARPPALDVFARQRVESVREQIEGKRPGTVMSGAFGGPPRQPSPPVPAQAAFRAADRDRDGKLTSAEAEAAARALFLACTQEGKGPLDEKSLTAGLERLWPKGGLFAPAPTAAARQMARGILKTAGKNGKIEEKMLVAAAARLFAEADSRKVGWIDAAQLEQALRRVMNQPGLEAPAGAEARK